MNNLLFEFTVDKTTKTVFVNREFAADLSLVWDAFTKQEILDQWWAPKPYVSKTKEMDFKVGGKRFYAMVSPEGQEHYAIQKYTSITPKTNFKYLNAFADKDENPSLPGSNWDLTFTEQNENTKVSITIYNDSLERMEQMIEMGFKEGFTMTLNGLEQLLMRNKIKVTATVNAGTKKVWDFYTQPKHITNWNFADPSWHCPSATNDLNVGGKYAARMEAKDGSFGFDFEAVYNEIVLNEKIVYTMADGRQAEVLFKGDNNTTEVVVTFDAETQNSLELQKNGWQAILDSFKKYTETY